MLRLLTTATVLLAVGALIAAPVPVETRKPAAFPAGRYILSGAGEAAQGDDAYEFTNTFRLRAGQYILSGGPKPTDPIAVNDDLEIHQDGKKLFVDDDHRASVERRGKNPATYQGLPIVLVLDPAKKARIIAINCRASDAVLGELWLHRWDGARKKLTAGKREPSTPTLPNTFFDESFALDEGFEMPEKVSTDAATDVPEKPATLLPRFKPAPAAQPAPANAKAVDTSAFLTSAIANGLNESGVEPALIAELAKRNDFLGKCDLCTPTQQALIAYGKLKAAPSCPKEARRLPEELLKALKSDNNETRRAALRDLVKRFVDAEFARLDLSKEQKTALQAKMETQRKTMSTALPRDQKFCPACDGACRLAPKL